VKQFVHNLEIKACGSSKQTKTPGAASIERRARPASLHRVHDSCRRAALRPRSPPPAPQWIKVTQARSVGPRREHSSRRRSMGKRSAAARAWTEAFLLHRTRAKRVNSCTSVDRSRWCTTSTSRGIAIGPLADEPPALPPGNFPVQSARKVLAARLTERCLRTAHHSPIATSVPHHSRHPGVLDKPSGSGTRRWQQAGGGAVGAAANETCCPCWTHIGETARACP
jgi:hypothetical protein